MRVLKPEVAQDRKEKILNWVVYNYVSTGRPVSSELIAEEGRFSVSSATIRSVLKELEETGYLYQAHTSGGRIPSDKGYRAYVDNISRMQQLASGEKARLETEYERRVDQLDGFLKHTSKMLSDMSQWAGFVMSADMEHDSVKRLDLLSMGPKSVLSVMFAHSGLIKHAAFTLEHSLDKAAVRLLSQKLNRRLKDLPLADLPGLIAKEFLIGERHKGAAELLKKMAEYFKSLSASDDALYLDGLSRIFSSLEGGSADDMRSVARLLEEKERFSGLLRERLRDCAQKTRSLAAPATGSLPARPGKRHIVEVTIGSENSMKEFKNFSLVSSAYCLNDKAVGLVGILGYKRMEYPRMITLVDTVSSMMEDMLVDWEKLGFDEE